MQTLRYKIGTTPQWFVLSFALMVTLWPAKSDAMDPEPICFAGSGKPKIDIVMCTRALMPSKALTRATLLTRRARARIQIQDDARALADLDEALAINPLSAEALIERARALRFLGRPEDARAALDQALRTSPHSARARTTRGVLALTLGDHAGAIADLSKVIATSPGLGESHALRGISHYFMDNPKAALKDFHEAASRGFGYAYLPLWIALAQIQIGEINATELQQARAALLDDQDWPAPVIAMYQMPGTEAVAAALDLANKGTAKLRRARIGQVHFLHGERLRLSNASESTKAFEAAVRDGDPRTVEHALAAQRLAALATANNSPRKN